MPALSDENKDKVRYHLNYKPGVTDSGVLAWLEEAMDLVPSNYAMARLEELLFRCEEAEKEAYTAGQDTDNESFTLAAKEIYDGDIQRSRVQLRAVPADERWDNYVRECDHLATKLNVPNLQDPEMLSRFSHLRTGGAYIKAIPGPSDTCRSDKIYMSLYYA
jgi:hypothetical protein